jgi:hypothetical protein
MNYNISFVLINHIREMDDYVPNYGLIRQLLGSLMGGWSSDAFY